MGYMLDIYSFKWFEVPGFIMFQNIILRVLLWPSWWFSITFRSSVLLRNCVIEIQLGQGLIYSQFSFLIFPPLFCLWSWFEYITFSSVYYQNANPYWNREFQFDIPLIQNFFKLYPGNIQIILAKYNLLLYFMWNHKKN